jgi:signal transduction histidine kinase/ActR/RegA family two-component response regulator
MPQSTLLAELGATRAVHAHGVSWTWNVVTGEVTWGCGVEQLFGLPPGGFGGTFAAYLALVHPEDRAYFQAVVARTLAGEDEYFISHRVLWPDGSVHWVDGRGRLTRDTEGRPLTLTGLDWTKGSREEANRRLTHLHRVQAVAGAVSKELLRVRRDDEVFELACRIAVEQGGFRFAWVGSLLGEGGPLVPLARAGFEDGYLAETASIHVEPVLGALRQGLRSGSASITNDIPGDEIFAAWRPAALARGFMSAGAFPLRRGGETMGALIIYAAEANRFDKDQIDLLCGLADDIGFKLDALDADARREVAELAKRRSEERYRALVEEAADAIFLADVDETLLEVNAAACEMTGYARAELVGRKLTELLDLTRRGQPIRRKDGTVIDAELTVTVLADGRIQGYARDVTKRNALQHQLILSDRMASLGRLAAGVAHEINNPLAYLAMNLQLIERATTGVPAVALLEKIAAVCIDARDGAERVRGVVRSLGLLTRDDEGAIRSVDVHEILDGAVRLAEASVRHRGHIVREYSASHRVRGNELRLGQVFLNLLVNASDALREDTPDENVIYVRTFDRGDRVMVEVEDNGTGIPPEITGRVFDPFFTTKPVGEGTGLGLSISHGIVSTFGGQIAVESTPGEGTTFRVSLVADESPPCDVSRAPTPDTERMRIRLLIVDDEARLAHSLAALLGHHDVTVATSAADALELSRGPAFDCILCDLMMPVASGMDLYADLARAGHGVEHRIIFMTGGAFTARSREFIDSISNEVLDKPFSASRAETAIAAVVQRLGRLSPAAQVL